MGSIGPTGKMLLMDEVTENELFTAFGQQAQALADGGVNAICIETQMAIDEAVCAIKAAQEYTDLEIICTFTFASGHKGDYRTMMGHSVQEIMDALLPLGVDIIGTNCGNGMGVMAAIVQTMRTIDSQIPILVQANAGAPVIEKGQTVYPESPQQMAARVPYLIAAGANIIGACCGSTPDHIRQIQQSVVQYKARM
jgi:5-methyltetrahydrofolate--homocysteine methyltransferase